MHACPVYRGNYDTFKEQEAIKMKQHQKNWEKQEKRLREMKMKGTSKQNAEKSVLKVCVCVCIFSSISLVSLAHTITLCSPSLENQAPDLRRLRQHLLQLCPVLTPRYVGREKWEVMHEQCVSSDELDCTLMTTHWLTQQPTQVDLIKRPREYTVQFKFPEVTLYYCCYILCFWRHGTWHYITSRDMCTTTSIMASL